MKLKAVLFDLDGTLRDTRELIYSSVEHTLGKLNVPVPSRTELDPYIHHHSVVHGQFAPHVTLDDFEQIYNAKVRPMIPYVQLYEGAAEVLQRLHDDGYKTAVVTASYTAPDDIPQYGIADFIDVVVSARDIAKHKPDPESTKLALERLGVKPEQAVLVGDMATDVRAANAAGITLTVGLTHGLGTRESLEAEGTSYIIDSLSELPDVLAVIEQNR